MYAIAVSQKEQERDLAIVSEAFRDLVAHYTGSDAHTKTVAAMEAIILGTEPVEPVPASIVQKLHGVSWPNIDPLLLGACFQHALDAAGEGEIENYHGGGLRRYLGAHYTSRENVVKVIEPLFLTDLVVRAQNGDSTLLDDIRELTFLDPAVGAAAFLVVIYEELRRIENGLLADGEKSGITLDQFFGIEVSPDAALVARLALQLARLRADDQYGESPPAEPTITVGNALRVEWADTVPAKNCSYIVGNPPFRGALKMTREQKADMFYIGEQHPDLSVGSLDLVSAWFVKAAVYMDAHKDDDSFMSLWDDIEAPALAAPKAAFVSTNSVVQGSHVPNLWGWMFARGIEIGFAYPSFRWENDSQNAAAVTTVIVGFGREGEFAKKYLFETDGAREVDFINGNLSDLNLAIVQEVRGTPLTYGVPTADLGNLARGAAFIIQPHERDEAVSTYPELDRWLPHYFGADEISKGRDRYCMWLVGAPNEVLENPWIAARLELIKQERLDSPKPETQAQATTPHIFSEIRQPADPYYAILTTSSAARDYIPIVPFEPSVIPANSLKVVEGASLSHFGQMTSRMHMAWMRHTSSRLGAGNDYSYSVASTYNTFPWLIGSNEAVEVAAQNVLDVRARYDMPIGRMYTDMPDDLLAAHKELDAVVDAWFGYEGDGSDDSRYAFLHPRYINLINSQNRP